VFFVSSFPRICSSLKKTNDIKEMNEEKNEWVYLTNYFFFE
jgi:hypothetical protein